MAVAYESHTTASRDYQAVNPEPIVFNKPTGLAEGDLMVAILQFSGTAGIGGSGQPTGFSLIRDVQDGGSSSMEVYAKIAEASDVSASTFTFNHAITTSAPACVGFMIRVSGEFSSIENIEDSLDFNNTPTTNHTFTPGLTPISVGSLYIMAVGHRDANATISGYAIANNNPTWTERQELSLNTADSDVRSAFATATPTSASDSGDFSATLSTSQSAYGLLLVINESVNASVSVDAPGLLTLSGNNHNLQYGYSISVDAPGVLTLSSQEHTPTGQLYEEYADQNKPSTSWTNQSK